MINEQIRDREVRVIGEDGEQLGIISPRDAMKLAEEAGVDLVRLHLQPSHLYVRLLIMVSSNMNRQEKKKKRRRSRR